MKLFDGTGEYVRADELKQGDTIRCPDRQDREVLTIQPGSILGIACTDGFGFECPAESRIIRRY